MLSRNLPLIFIVIFPILRLIHSASAIPFNLSHFLFPKVTAFTETSLLPQPPHLLQDVLGAIASKENWTLNDMRVSELDSKKARYASVTRYEFSSQIRKSKVVIKMYEEPIPWKKLAGPGENASLSFEALVRKLGSKIVIDSLKLEGPLELRVVQDEDELSLMLPPNSSHSGLRRITVGRGFTIELKGAEEISIAHPPHIRIPQYGIPANVISIWPAFCTMLPAIRIVGSASVVAYRSLRPSAEIQTKFPSIDVIELLPDKCYVQPNNEKPKHLFSSLTFLQRVLASFPSVKRNTNSGSGFLKTRIRASMIFRFQLELDRDIRANDSYWSTLADWRTKPSVEQVRYEVVARIEGEVLKPLLVKKVRPFVDVDSFAWSSLLSNLSFTKFPPVVLPPEALTLDVKW